MSPQTTAEEVEAALAHIARAAADHIREQEAEIEGRRAREALGDE